MHKIDLVFYKLFYSDLRDLNKFQLLNHAKTLGVKEKRLFNVNMVNDFFKNINFNPDFYIQVKKLQLTTNQYRSVLAYLEYQKNLDFKNEQELESFLKEKIDLEFVKIFYEKENLIEIYQLYSRNILNISNKKIDKYLSLKNDNNLEERKKLSSKIESKNHEIQSLKEKIDEKEKEKKEIEKIYLNKLEVEKYKLKLKYKEDFFFFNKIEPPENFVIFREFINLLNNTTSICEEKLFNSFHEKNTQKILDIKNNIISEILKKKKKIVDKYLLDKSLKDNEYFKEGIEVLKLILDLYVNKNIINIFNLNEELNFPNFKPINIDKLLNVDYDFVFEFYKLENLESFFEKVMEKDVILNKIELKGKIKNEKLYSKKYNQDNLTIDNFTDLVSMDSLNENFLLKDCEAVFNYPKNTVDVLKLKENIDEYLLKASEIYCDRNLKMYYQKKQNSCKIYYFLGKNNYENINFDFIDIIYIEELDYDFLVDKIPLRKRVKKYNNFKKFSKLEKIKGCKYNLGLINFTPISTEPLKVFEVLKSLMKKNQNIKLFILGTNPNQIYNIKKNPKFMEYYSAFYKMVRSLPKNVSIQYHNDLEEFLPKIGNILIYGNDFQAEKMFKYAIGSGCIPFNSSQDRYLVDEVYFNKFHVWNEQLSQKVKSMNLENRVFLDLNVYLNKNNIKQIHISDALSHLKNRIFKVYNLNEYNSKTEKCIFFGLYLDEDFQKLNNHQGEKIVMLGGSDLPNIKRVKFDKILSISRNVRERLLKIGYNSELIDFNLVDREIFKPIENLGSKIYVYDGIIEKPDNEMIYNTKLVEKVKELLPDYEYIHSSKLGLKNEEMAKIYSKCFIGLRLTNADGNANTVQEFEAMNIPIIHNQSDYGIKWNNENDIVEKIKKFNEKKNETKKIFKEIKNNNILIVIDFILDLVAGDTMMVKNYINHFSKNGNKLTLLSKHTPGEIFKRDIFYNLNFFNFKSKNKIDFNSFDIIFSRTSCSITDIIDEKYLYKTIVYGLDAHLSNIQKLNNKFMFLVTQSNKLKEFFEKNSVEKEKIIIQEPFSVKYDFELPKRKDNELRLIYCGTLRDEENIIEIIEEFKKIHQDRPEVVLKIVWGKIVGDSVFKKKINEYLNNGVEGITFKHKLSHKEACYEIATSDIGICWRKNGWGDNGEISTKVKEYELYGINVTSNMLLTVGVVTCTNKIGNIDLIINNFKNQKYIKKKLYFVINNNSIPVDIYNYKLKKENINFEILKFDEKYNLGYCLNKTIDVLKKDNIDIFSKFDDDDIYGGDYLLEQIFYLNKYKNCIVGKYDTIIWCRQYDNFYKIINFDKKNTFTNFCRGSTLSYFIKNIDKKFDEIQTSGIDSIFIKNQKIYCTSNKNYIWIRNKDMDSHTWKIDIHQKFSLEKQINNTIKEKYFNGLYVLKNINSGVKVYLYNNTKKTKFITHPTIEYLNGFFKYDERYISISPFTNINKTFSSEYGIITSSNLDSGLVYESNFFIKYLNIKNEKIPELFFFQTSSGRNACLEDEYNYISYVDSSFNYLYNEGISLKEFIKHKKTIIIYEIFSKNIFEFILNQGVKIIFFINSDCFIDWDDKNQRNLNVNLEKLKQIKKKYFSKFIIGSKNIPTNNYLKENSIETSYFPTFIGSEIISFNNFEKKYNSKQINVSIVLGSGYQIKHRKSLENYLPILYEIIEENPKINFSIYSPKKIIYDIKKIPNLFIYIAKSDKEIKTILEKTHITFYFSNFDGLGITPMQYLSAGCYVISIFNDSFDLFDCYLLKEYISSKKIGKKHMSDIYEVKNIQDIKEIFFNVVNNLGKINDNLVEFYNNIVNINSYKNLIFSLISKEFLQKEKITSDKIKISLATYPKKKLTSLYNIENLLNYADNINIYLNSYSKIPKIFDLLNNTDLFNVETTKDNKALSKFNIFKKEKEPCYIFTVDDDLYYSKNYIKNMIYKYNNLKKKILKDLVLSSVGRIFNNLKIVRYGNPTQIIRINEKGMSIVKGQKNDYDLKFVDLVGTGNSLFYNTKNINDIINSIYNLNLSFKTVSLDETFSIVSHNKNIVKICSSMEKQEIFIRNICSSFYKNLDLSGLHELKTKDKKLVKDIENKLKEINFLDISQYRFNKIKILIIGWWNSEAYPVNILVDLFEKLNYEVHFYGLKLNKNKFLNDDTSITKDILNYVNDNKIQLIYWFNWKFNIQQLKIIKKTNVKNIIYNWDPVDHKLNNNFKDYFNLVDYTFISQELQSYDSKKYSIFYPGFNHNIRELDICNKFIGDVCFVITNYYDNRDILIQLFIKNNISVSIYGPEKLKKKFPKNYKGLLKKEEVYKIYNSYKISINYTIQTEAREYVNERVSEVFYAKGLMLTNLDNSVLRNNFNCIVFKDKNDCLKKVKNILNLYNSDLTFINKIKTNGFETAIKLLDYRKTVLDQHVKIINII